MPQEPDEKTPVAAQETLPKSRSGDCPFCLRKHLLKARGYAKECLENATREWERDNLLENLMLAEDHADAAGLSAFQAEIRTLRIRVEDGSIPLDEIKALHEKAKAMLK